MEHTLTVTGAGSASATPDAARVRVAATVTAESVARAMDALTSASAEVSRLAREVTEPGAVSTANLQVWPRHDDQGRPVGFEASHQIHVLCPGLDAVSQLLSDLASRVGDHLRIDGIDLEISDPSTAVEQAREAAFADATERAQHLAGLAGRPLGAVVRVVEGGAFAGAPVRAARAMVASAPALEAGEQQVRSSVEVTWELA